MASAAFASRRRPSYSSAALDRLVVMWRHRVTGSIADGSGHVFAPWDVGVLAALDDLGKRQVAKLSWRVPPPTGLRDG